MNAFSFFPAIPLPQLSPRPELIELDPADCVYLPGLRSTTRAFSVRRLSPDAYQALMDAGFRRSGHIIYQPICTTCRACMPIRVPVNLFTPHKSQRRCWRKNADLLVSVGPPDPTAEKHAIYIAYQTLWHASTQPSDFASFISFLYDSPTDTLEFVYRDPAGKLVGVGLCDLCSTSLSSVYFYFDPAHAPRSPGTYSALYEIHWARQHHLRYWYAGYHVAGCSAMDYKSNFRPHEFLSADGTWRPAND